MGQVILCIPADSNGNKLWIKNFEKLDNKLYLEYKSTYNDIPFRRTEIFISNDNLIITGDDGTILYRFPSMLINSLIDE